MSAAIDLSRVASSELRRIRDGIATGSLRAPVDRAGLVGLGVRHQLDALLAALAGHRSPAALAVLDAVLAERAAERPPPELVWTGPEAKSGTARDTAVVLRELFEGARERVILAGYSFDHAREVLAPLHATMLEHQVAAHFFIDVPQVGAGIDPDAHLRESLGGFVRTSWPFGEPRPRLYYDKRALVPGPPWSSLHAKCVVVDGRHAFVSSANFTQRGQERNIEVGVLIEDPSFASFLAGQLLGLVSAGIAREYVP